ncbi:MAG: hypothetical protein V4527_18365 [Pseudomonadota bacterium]
MAEFFQSLGSVPWNLLGGMGAWSLVLALLALLIRERHRNRLLDSAEDRQRVELGIQMLEAARNEITRLNVELADSRVWADVLSHLAEAERHLNALVTAEPADVAHAKAGAMAFLKRMSRLREARGVIRNEVQIAVSEGRMEKK